jgi:hypothetical protein
MDRGLLLDCLLTDMNRHSCGPPNRGGRRERGQDKEVGTSLIGTEALRGTGGAGKEVQYDFSSFEAVCSPVAIVILAGFG